MEADVAKRLVNQVVKQGICTGCGACVAAAGRPAKMVRTPRGPEPEFADGQVVPELAWQACAGKGVDYPTLYRQHFGALPTDWRVGQVDALWTGYAGPPDIRRAGASGGVTTQTLIYLLETGRIEAAILVRQGIPTPGEASWFIARSRQEIIDSAQSVYIPVSVLDVLPELIPGERYAISCLPEQSAALRVLQQAGHPQAQQVDWVVGPYTGTALDPKAIRALLRSQGVRDDDEIRSLKWRAGEWPGYLEIITASGREIRSKKVYYNFLIPFFVTQTSLQSMDFANEFTDLSVGDAWSPKYEALGQGFSVVASRTEKMSNLLREMEQAGLLHLESQEVLEASAMHGHMIDFKKRGGYLRNQWRRRCGLAAPDYGLDLPPVDRNRIMVEIVISSIFTICRTPLVRWIMEKIPESILGPLFNRLRLIWKAASKPAKRKGLRDLQMVIREPKWKIQS